MLPKHDLFANKHAVYCFQAQLSTKRTPKQVIIALEPEAASLYCRSLKLNEFFGGKGATFIRDKDARDGTQYLVIDIGGSEALLTLTFARLIVLHIRNRFTRILLPCIHLYFDQNACISQLTQ